MLILTRRSGEGVTIGDQVRVVILGIKGGQVRVGIDAPASTPVHREEVYARILAQNLMAGTDAPKNLKVILDVWKRTFKTGEKTPSKKPPILKVN